MNLEVNMQREVSQKEKNQMWYINTDIWDLERWYWWIDLQVSNGETDIENRLMDMGWGREVGEGEMYGESNMETCITISNTDSQL